ncbi:MAG TPA: hypothetical protein VN695_05000 [Streptosporangiaceae bacterium]|nr:hypothetical protein [Streptosporangiaceae bacterium]
MASLSRRSARLIAPAAALLTLAGGTAAVAASTPGHVAMKAATTKLTWHPFTLINGWKSASKKELVTGQPAWAYHNGIVYFRGAIMQPNPAGGVVFANLPKFARPAHKLYIQVYTNGDDRGILYVGNGGTLKALDGNAFTFTSLAAVSYPTAAVKSHKLTLENGWTSSQSVYGTGDPSYAVSGGVVYLSGSLHTSGTSQLATVLPKAARPAHRMVVAVYTFDDIDVGWVDIMPTGQVRVFGADAPIFTSLANISYPVVGTKWHNFKLEDGWKSGQATFGTATPAYAIINGIVYLNGSMTGATAPNGLWTTLPVGVRTAADVLEIEVYTAGGSVGGIAITASLGLVSSTPFSNAKQFTSLAALAYPQSS